MQQQQCAAGEDVSPSSQLLIEDRRQGCTSAAALSTLAKYAAFVQRTRAPIASMNYSPFTKAKLEQQEQMDVSMHKFDAASINEHFDKLHLDEVLPATHGDASTVDESLSKISDAPVTAPGGEAWTVDVSQLGWIKTSGNSNPGSKRGSVMSKRGSLIGGASRKTSMNAGDSRLWSTSRMDAARSRTGGFESSNAICWNMLGTVEGRHYDRGLDLIESSLSGHKQEGGWAGADKKEGLSGSSSRRTSVKMPQQYLRAHQAELKYGLPALAAVSQQGSHAASAQQQQLKSKRASMPPMHGRRNLLSSSTASAAATQSNATSTNQSSGSGASRRGSVTGLNQHALSREAISRARSQSLPSDSLFLAYSQCPSLSPVMASSLASMPVPSQPAIPVAVARRYSVLLQQGQLPQEAGLEQTNNNQQTQQQQPASSPNATSEQSMVNVDPSSVSGIDTSSVLDTTALHDLVSPTEAGDSLLLAPIQPARRGSITSSISAALMHHGAGGAGGQVSSVASRHSSPASSPIDSGAFASQLPNFSPLASNATLNMSSLGTTRSRNSSSMLHSESSRSGLLSSNTTSPLAGASATNGPASSPSAGLRISASLSGTDSPAGLSSAAASPLVSASSSPNAMLPALSITSSSPSGDSLPDFTPMTSPTNLSHATFRHALMARRMSDVVARDIGAKLEALQKQMNADAQGQGKDGIEAMRSL